jgi:hypothetical protein
MEQNSRFGLVFCYFVKVSLFSHVFMSETTMGDPVENGPKKIGGWYLSSRLLGRVKSLGIRTACHRKEYFISLLS